MGLWEQRRKGMHVSPAEAYLPATVHGARQQAAQGSGHFLGLLSLKWDGLGETPVPSQ